MRRQRRLIAAIVATITTVIVGLVVFTPALAANNDKYDEAWLMKKVLINGIYTCYNGGHIRAKVTIGGSGNFVNAGSIALDNTDGVVKLPNGYTNITDNDLSCQQLLHGYNGTGGNFSGIFSYSSMSEATSNSPTAEQGAFLEKMGYAPDASSGGGGGRKCARFKYIMTDVKNGSEAPFANEVFTQQICAQVDSNGTILSETEPGADAAGKDPLGMAVLYGQGISMGGAETNPASCYVGGNFDTCVSELHSWWQSQKNAIAGGTYESGNYSNYVASDEIDWESEDSFVPNYVMPTAKPDVATQSLFGDSNKTFTTDEIISMYQIYLNKYMEDMFCIVDESAKDTPVSASYTKMQLVVDGKYYKDCYVKNGSAPSTLNGSDGSWSKEVSIEDIFAYLNAHSASQPQRIVSANARLLDKEDIENERPDPNNPYSGGTEGDPSTKCYKSAGVLGHILCPILSAVSQFTDSIYYYIENNFLMVNAQALTGGDVRNAWGIVRDIANVCFAIILLVIIFSQITGLGIDNYGIKRLLPRLIVMAVMVNVSFLICQVLVDVSNILGVNLKQFLSGAVTLEAAAEGSGAIAATGILETIAGGGILAGLAFLNPGIILALVAGIIGVIIGLLFLFVILIARQIAIVVLIVLSPIAFICYMLPNTERYFGIWKKAFIALLVVYPLCSLAMGGGTMVANILANAGDISNNTVLLIGAMFTNVVPFFFIPTLLQNSLAALGGIGAKISSLGQRIGRGAGNLAAEGVKRTRAFNNLSLASKQFQDEHLRKGEKRMLERRAARLNDRMKEKGGLSSGQQRRLALAQSRLNAMNAEDAAAEAGIKAKDYDTLLAGANARRLQEDIADIKAKSVDDGIVNNLTGNKNFTGMGDDYAFGDDTLEAALYNAAISGDQAAMLAYADQLSEKGHAGQEGLGQVLSKLEANGREGAARSIAQSIMNGSHSGEYKKGARSQYDHMKELAGGKSLAELGNIRDLSKIQAKSYSKESLANADKEELTRIAKAISQGAISGSEIEKFQELANGALNDSRIEGGTKLENEKLLESMLNANNTIQVHQPTGAGGTAENGRFAGLSNDQLLEAATRPGVDAGTASRAMAEIERRQKNGTMKV